jgi:60 kDa SS-A/Ro ribonucleoprotein
MNGTFYTDAQTQLGWALALCSQVEPPFIGKTAIYTREKGRMKDMPALLCAVLASLDGDLLERVFPKVIDNGRMLRTFVQIIRSGVTGRKSLGTRPKRLVQEWITRRSDTALFRDSVGQYPSMADVLKMVHPKPVSPVREALYGYLIGRNIKMTELPEQVRAFEEFKRDPLGPVPDVPFQMLTSLDLGVREWTAIALNSGWQMLRMNLNTFARHGVFADESVVEVLSARLKVPDQVAKARVQPYQLLAACSALVPEAPMAIREALWDALELSTANAPKVEGSLVLCPDVSGSMRSAVTGYRGGSTGSVTCVEVAALITACMARRNPRARILPFEQDVVELNLNPRDSLTTLTRQLAAVGGGGTNCSAPLDKLNRERAEADLVLIVSDNESWVDTPSGSGTELMRQWRIFRSRNPKARLVCLDIVPGLTTQAPDEPGVINVGGFSDAVFEVISLASRDELAPEHWVQVIEKINV